MRGWAKGVAGGALASVFVLTLFSLQPLPAQVLSVERQASAEYWSRDGVLLHARVNPHGARCLWRTGSELPPNVKSAFVALEDRRFYEHHGIDWRSMARAVGSIFSKRRSGGSTITMQLARLLDPVGRTVGGKARQGIDAVRLERTFSKETVLEQYLNRVPLGRGVEGVEAAALVYFGKRAVDLSDDEALFVAALAPAPSRLDPRFDREAACRAFTRAAERLARARTSCPSTRFTTWVNRAPHFVELLPATAGKRVTTLDAQVQQRSARVLASHRQRLLINGVEHAALVVLDARTGELRALLGSFDFGDRRAGQVNAALAPRQAGSILKPLLYGVLLEQGASLDTPLHDDPRCFRTADELFCPRNYDDGHRGTVSLRVALASSLNIPAVEALERVGIESFSDKLASAGLLKQPASGRPGLGLALGDVDVRLLDVTRAFGALTGDGVLRRPSFDSGASTAPVQLFSSTVAGQLREALSDVAARRPGFGEAASIRHIALKTGTSTWARDLWALVADDQWVVGVWLGNADGSPTDSSAIEAAAPLAVEVLDAISTEVQPGCPSGECP